MNYFDVLFAKKQSGGGETPTLITKTITANGTYNASEDNADGYSQVTVAVDGFKKKSIANTPTDIASFADGTANPMPSLEISINPVQSGSGDPSPENVRPISGWSGANVTKCGKNLFDINGGTSFTYDYVTIQNNKIVISSIGNGRTSRAYFTKTYKPGTYTFSAKMSGQLEGIRFFSPQPFAGGVYSSYYGGYYFDIINGQTTVTMVEPFTIGVIGGGPAGGQGEIYDIQLELGSTATSYSPYQGSTLSIPFHDNSDNPITVYGGTLDVTSGELRATMAMVDMGTLEWVMGTPSGAIIYNYFSTTINDIKRGISAKASNILSALYRTVSSDNVAKAGYDSTIAVGNTTVFVADSRYNSAAAFKTAMSGQTLVYELETPQTYQLTPAQVTTLLNQNNIFADCGQILEGEYFVTL